MGRMGWCIEIAQRIIGQVCISGSINKVSSNTQKRYKSISPPVPVASRSRQSVDLDVGPTGPWPRPTQPGPWSGTGVPVFLTSQSDLNIEIQRGLKVFDQHTGTLRDSSGVQLVGYSWRGVCVTSIQFPGRQMVPSSYFQFCLVISSTSNSSRYWAGELSLSPQWGLMLLLVGGKL